MRPHTAFLFALLSSALGCSHEIEGPNPSLKTDQEGTFCAELDRVFTVRGHGLSPMVVDGATDHPDVELPKVCLVLVEDADGNAVADADPVCLPEENVTWISQSEMEFHITPDLGLAPGVYDVIIRNPDGTEARGTFRLTVLSEGPLVFWVDPPVVYNGITTRVTIYGSGLGAVRGASIVDDAGVATELGNVEADPANPNHVLADVPLSTPVGTYDVVLVDQQGCEAALPDGLTVTDQIGLDVAAIDPSFGWTGATTPVTITGTGFQSIPRAYLNPTEPAADTVASALASLQWLDDGRLTAVVPADLPADQYDLIVVNPDGTVGLLEDAFLVTADPPPVIDGVTPGFVDNGTDADVTITGANFRDPAVSITCLEPDGTEPTLDATVADFTDALIHSALPVTTLPAGTVCIVRVTNSDGSYFDYSAIGVSTPASNLSPFQVGTPMIEARRAPAVAAGRANRSARFVYAVGGDDGSAAGAKATVESAPVDVFGVPGAWFAQPVSLATPRTLAGIVSIGRFLYLVGGNDGTGTTTEVSRALVLDPLQAPQIADVGARRGNGGEGIGAGVWYYRVAAVMDDADPSNPGGETLPSDVLAVNLPDSLEGTLVLTIVWTPVTGAKGYRVYRSPDPDMPAGSELLLAEVEDGAVTSYEDASGAPAGAPPRPLGSTGVWVDMPPLTTAREAAGVAIARDPDDPTVSYIYAVAGRGGAALASYEYVSVTEEADGTQTVGDWIAGGTALATARSGLSAFSLSHAESALVPAGSTWIYAGGGEESTEVDAAEVQAGGALASWTAVDGMSPARSGYGGLAGAGFLFGFGGQNGAPGDGVVSAEIGPAAPDLVNWNNEGDRLTVGRFLAGTAVESAFIYVVGGVTDTGVSNTTERTVL